MPTLDFQVKRNVSGALAQALDAAVNKAIRTQIEVTRNDVKANIVAMDYIDTGATLNSVQAEMIGPTEGKVSVGTEYAVFGNFGTRYQAPRPFFTQAETKAAEEFPKRMKAAVEGAVG